jgi:tetratricopeptide (TPR) repeat protein
MLPAGSRLNEYTIVAPIGAGGMGEVYSALDTRLKRQVAIKVLPSYLATDADRLRRFEQEAMAAAALSHPNILSVFQLGLHEGAPFLVCELLEGGTLRDQLAQGPLPLAKAMDCAGQGARGLAAAHEKGILHRDLKPENLFLTRDGRLKILDFGLAKLVRPAQADVDSATLTAGSGGTAAGTVLGTPGYMSPEQVRGHTVDHRSDIFSFGAVLYEMLTGRRAFHKPTAPETMSAVLNEAPLRVSELKPTVPPLLQRVVERCLEKDPDQRFQSASDLAFALQAVSDSGPVAAPASPARGPGLRGIAITAAAAAAIGLALGGYFYRSRTPALTEKDAIVLADFTNTTGEPVFDDTLRQGLSVQLRQTPFFRLVSPDRIAHSLRLMEKPPGTRLTPEVARQVCQRAGATIEVDGSIAPLGSQFVLGLTALHCGTGDVVAQVQATARDRDGVLAALTAAASELRAKLGESKDTLERYAVPLVEATTPSLDALQAFSRANTEFNASRFVAAVTHLERAVGLDPKFAAAYSVLATARAFTGNTNLAAEDARSAYTGHDRVSEYERLFLTANYHLWSTGDLEQAVQSGRVWVRTYPSDYRAYAQLCYVLRLLGRNDEALAIGRKAIEIEPASGPSYTTPMFVYFRQGRLDEVAATLKEAEANGVDTPFLYFRYMLAFLRGDDPGMAEQLQAFGPGGPGFAALTAAYRGQRGRAIELGEQGKAALRQVHSIESVRSLEARGALIDALFGLDAEARRAALAFDRSTAGFDAEANAALALALAGDASTAPRIATELGDRHPQGTFVQFYYLPAIRAALALRKGRPAEAIERLRAASSYELARYEASSGATAMMPAYLRGQAHLAAGQGAKAAVEFQRILDNPGTVLNFPVGALARLGLARAQVLGGDSNAARTSYQEFLAAWNDADPDLPILKEAKAEAAKLR